MGISVCDFNTFPVQLACQGQEKEVGQFQLHIREWESVSEENTVSVLGREEGYTVKYTPSPEGFPEGEARGNS